MAAKLADAGHDVDLLTTFPHYPEWAFAERPAWREQRTVDGVRVSRLRHRLPRGGSAVSRVVSELSFGLRAMLTRWNRPEAAVLVSPALFASAVLVPRLLLQRVPFTLWVQDLYGVGVQETAAGDRLGIAARLVGALEACLLRRADAVVVIHEGMAASVLALGVEPERLSVVRNWSHVEPAPAFDRAAVRAGLGWTKGETIVLHTGNMGVKQHLTNVVEAGRVAERAGAGIRFVLIGDGVERAGIEAAAAGLHHVQVLPPLPAARYAEVLGAADVLLVNEHPGVREMALPSKLTSYFGSGRPVIASTNAGSATSRELRRAGAGDCVEAGDPEALVGAVERLVADPARMRVLGAAGGHYRRTALDVGGAVATFERVLLETAARTASDRLRTPVREAVPVLVPARASRPSQGSGVASL